jgi:hypothetical protein
MATLTFQLETVQSNLTPTPFTPPDPEVTNTPVNANQAQGAPVPLDTVTLAAQTAQGQGTAPNQNDGQQDGPQNGQQDGQLQSSPAFAAAAALFAGAISTISQNGNNATATQTASGSGNSTNGKSTLADIANSVLQQATATTPSQPDLAQAQKQQLQQLDQTLRQLGIDPQSISVFNQLAMLFYSNNPSDLQQFIRQVQLAAQKVLQQGTATSAAESQTASQALNASGDTTASSSAEVANSAAQAADGSPQPDADSGNQSNAAAQQFQELQFAVAAVGGQVQLPRPTSAPGPPDKSPQRSLDVTL